MDMRRQTCCFFLFCSLSATLAFAQATGKTLPPSPNCRITTTYQGGTADNFTGGPDPSVRSPALTTYVTLVGKPTRQYDEKACDKYLAESFLINKCQICETLCTAELEIRYKPSNCGLDCNDTFTVGQAPFTGTGSEVTVGQLYSPCVPTPPGTDTSLPAGGRARATTPGAAVTQRFPLDVTKLKALCAKTPGSAFWLDVIVQDDTNVDYIKLILTHN
jgi:hypothetical protein